MAAHSDPSIPPINGRCCMFSIDIPILYINTTVLDLLALPIELRLEILKLSLDPSPRALLVLNREADDPLLNSTPYKVCSVEVGNGRISNEYGDIFAVRKVCRKMYNETKGLRVNLNTITVANSNEQNGLKHFNALVQTVGNPHCQDIRSVTIRHDILESEVRPFKVPYRPRAFFTSDLSFFEQNPHVNLRMVVWELGNTGSIYRTLYAGNFILYAIRNRRPERPAFGYPYAEYEIAERNLIIAKASFIWRLPNIKFVPPLEDRFADIEEELRRWLVEEHKHPQATVDFWMREVESWYTDGI